jgi:universal stress protein A
MFQHILCPTDLGERAEVALQKAVQIAHQFGAQITLLNVHAEFMDRRERSMLRVSVQQMKDKFQQIALESKAKMREAIGRLHADDVAVEYLLREGDPARVIVEAAGALQADLIVMSTDGRDNIKDFVTGTITEHVINGADCPVLVVPFKRP